MNDDPTLRKFELLEAELYKAVGEMIKVWAQVDSWLAHIFHLLLFNNNTGRQGETIFYELQSIQQRIKIVEAALFNRDDISEEIKNNSKVIIKAINDESAERNRIIHGDFQRGCTDDATLSVAVTPKVFSDLRRPMPPVGITKFGYETSDVRLHIERIDNLRLALWAFYVELGAKDSSPLKSSQEYLEIWRKNCDKCVWPSVVTKKS